MMKKSRWGVGYGIALTAFTVYIALDTFVISSSYQANATQMNLEMFAQTASVAGDSTTDGSTVIPGPSDDAYITAAADLTIDAGQADNTVSVTDNDLTGDTDQTDSTSALTPIAALGSYQSDDISITLSEYYEHGSHIYVADVETTSAQFLKTAFANDIYGRNVTETTSVIAADHEAILAVNGDFYGTQETGYVIRNGILYRSDSNGEEVLCILADGTMQVVDSSVVSAQELLDMGVWQVLCFGPGLLEDGEITVTEGEEVGKAKASNPRTAIGIIDNNHYLFVVSDGRTDESEGLSLYELAQFMQSLGVTTAYNLDGGGSSTMVFQGEVINNPTSGKRIKERSVSDIVYIG